MSERIVKRVTRTGRPQVARDFTFTQEMIPSQNGSGAAFVNEARLSAWETSQSLPMPHTKLEPWRRTDLRSFAGGELRLPDADSHKSLAPVPADLLAPLVGDEHGGLIVLKPGASEVMFSELLAAKGVVFTDYATAEREYPELLNAGLCQCGRQCREIFRR